MGSREITSRLSVCVAATFAFAGAAFFAPVASATPSASDFSQALPSLERIDRAVDRSHFDEGPVTARSPTIVAPQSFDLAGIKGQTRTVELRGRRSGGTWTEWTETSDGNPVWFGGMDELQIRTRGWTPSGRIQYVSVETEATEATPRAGGGKPNIVSREQWGANRDQGGCKPRKNASEGKVKAAYVHHTVSATNYSESQAAGMVLGICRFHRDSNGWDDIGYNALVDRFGNIYEGRAGGLARPVIGAHAEGYNAQSTGTAVLGTHSEKPISRAAMRGLSKWLAWKLPEHGRDATGTARLVSAGGGSNRYSSGTRVNTARIIGHRRTNFTDCPGRALKDQLSRLRNKVQRRIKR